MFKKLALICTLMFALPALANATWYVSASTSPSAGGTVSPAGTTSYADTAATASYTVTANPGYSVSSVKVGGVTVAPVGSTYTVAKKAGTQYLVAYFKTQSASVTPTITSGLGAITAGFSSPLPSNLVVGQSYTFKIKPNTGYAIADVKADGTSVGAVSSYTFNAITAGAHTISASFNFVPAVTAAVSASGTMAISSPVTLTAVASTNDTAITGYQFVVSGAEAHDSGMTSSKTYSFTPAKGGVYNVALAVTTTNGGSGGATTSFTVQTAKVASVNECATCHSARNPELVATYTASGHNTNDHGPACLSCHNPANTLQHPYPTTIGFNACGVGGICHNGPSPYAPAKHFSNISASYVAKHQQVKCEACHFNFDPHNLGGAQVPAFLGQYAELMSTFAEQGHADTNAGAWKINSSHKWDNQGTPGGDEKNAGARGCVRCHTPEGFLRWTGGLDKPAFTNTTSWGGKLVSDPKNGAVLGCYGCHNQYSGELRQIGAVTVYYNYSSTATGFKGTVRNVAKTYPDVGASNLCVSCHTGRQSGDTYTALIAKFGNLSGSSLAVGPHDAPAGLTLFANAFNASAFVPAQKGHDQIGVANYNGTGNSGPCATCHGMSSTNHSFEAKADSALCVKCHTSMDDATVAAAQANLQAATAVLAQVMKNAGYAVVLNSAGAFDRNSFPAAVSKRFNNNKLGSTMNAQLLSLDAGSYVHNPAYVRKMIADAIDAFDDGVMNGSSAKTIEALVPGVNAGTVTQDQINKAVTLVVADRASCEVCHSDSIDAKTSQNIVATFNAGGHATNGHGPTCVSCHAPATGTLAHPTAVMLTAATAINPKCEGCHKPATSAGSTYFTANAYREHWGNTFNAAFYTNRNNCNDCHNGHDPVTGFGELYVTYAEQGHANTVTVSGTDPVNPTGTRGQWRRPNSAGLPATANNSRTRQCSICHLQDGLLTYVGAPNGEATVSNPYTTTYTGNANSVLGCKACHTNAIGTIRQLPAAVVYYNYSVSASAKSAGVSNTSGKVIAANVAVTYPDAKSSNVCVVCHSGGGDNSISPQVVTALEAGLKNLSSAKFTPGNHQMIAAQTLYAKGYNKNIASPAGNHPHTTIGTLNGATSGPCAGCHNLNSANHSWEAVDANGAPTNSALCSQCHVSNFNVDAAKEKFLNNKVLTVQILNNYGRKVTLGTTGSIGFTNMTGNWGPGGKLFGEMQNLSMFNNDAGAFAHNPGYAAQIMKSAIEQVTGKAAATAIAEVTSLTVANAALTGAVTIDQAKAEFTSTLTLSEKHVATSGTYRTQYTLTGSTGSSPVTCGSCHNPAGETTLQAEARVAWAESGHGETTALPWQPGSTHLWRNAGYAASYADAASGSDCVRCHTPEGFAQFVGSNFTNVNPVASAADAAITSPLNCNACHVNPINATTDRRVVPQVTIYYNISTAGVQKTHLAATFPNVGESNMCISCHAGRVSGAALADAGNKGFNFTTNGFQNSHYMAAAGMMYVKSGFTAFAPANTVVAGTSDSYGQTLTAETDNTVNTAGTTVVGKLTSTHRKLGTTAIRGDSHNTSFFVAGNLDTNGPCVTCHLQGYTNAGDKRPGAGHSLEIDSAAWNQVCNNCHAAEAGFAANGTPLLVEEQKEPFDAAMGILKSLVQTKLNCEFDSTTYPYFFKAGLAHTSANAFKAFGNVKNEGAAFNLNLLAREPFAYVHARTYTRRLIYDTIDYLDDNTMNQSVSSYLAASGNIGAKPADASGTTANDAVWQYFLKYDRTTKVWNTASERP
jgi:hypothetical protein